MNHERRSTIVRHEIARDIFQMASQGFQASQIIRRVIAENTELKNNIPFLAEYFWLVFNLELRDVLPAIDTWVVSKQLETDDRVLDQKLMPLIEGNRVFWQKEIRDTH